MELKNLHVMVMEKKMSNEVQEDDINKVLAKVRSISGADEILEFNLLAYALVVAVKGSGGELEQLQSNIELIWNTVKNEDIVPAQVLNS